MGRALSVSGPEVVEVVERLAAREREAARRAEETLQRLLAAEADLRRRGLTLPAVLTGVVTGRQRGGGRGGGGDRGGGGGGGAPGPPRGGRAEGGGGGRVLGTARRWAEEALRG